MPERPPPARWSARFPVDLHVGRGARAALADGPSGPWLLVSSRRGRAQAEADALLAPLLAERVVDRVDDVTANPDLAWLEATARRLRGNGAAPAAVLGLGGGSALDAAKALAALLAAPEGASLEALLRDPSPLDGVAVAPLLAVATTAGSGSEVTPFATVWDSASSLKASLAHEAIRPALAVVDADLMDDLPREVTIATGLDAINQAAESTWNRRATPVTLELAGRALELGVPALERLLDHLADRAAREAMAEASALAGLAISHTRTALCHAISYPLTARHGVPHGIACAFTMAVVAEHQARADDGRLARAAARLGERGAAGLARRLAALQARAGVAARVRDALGSLEALLALAGGMRTPGRADNALRPADEAALEAVLRRAWELGA